MRPDVPANAVTRLKRPRIERFSGTPLLPGRDRDGTPTSGGSSVSKCTGKPGYACDHLTEDGRCYGAVKPAPGGAAP